MVFDKEKSLAAAKRFIQKGQIDKAIFEYKRIVENDPEDIKYMQKLAELQVRQGARQEAVNTFLRLADILVRKGFANRAISIYKQILQLNPLLLPVYIKLAEIFKQLGLSKDARIFNQRAVEIVQKAGTAEDVYKLLVKIIDIDPEDAISRIALAEACVKMNNTETAISHFEAALSILREQHLNDLFIRAAERLLFYKPDNIELCRELAILYLKRRETPKAMKLLLHCRKYDPEDLETLDLLIAHFLSTQNIEKAVLILLEKLKILSKKGLHEEAAEVAAKVLDLDPNNQEARKYMQASPVYTWNNLQPPVVPLEPTASAPPPPLASKTAEVGNIENRIIEEADILMKYGLKEKAVEHLSRALEETFGSARIRERLKDIYLEMGEIELGIEQLFALAQQSMTTDPGKAQMFLKEILLLSPHNTRAEQMLALLGDRIPAEAGVTITKPAAALWNVDSQPREQGLQEEEQDYSQFLNEETTDIFTLPPPSRRMVMQMDEPFLGTDFPPLPGDEPRITNDDLRALEIETSEEMISPMEAQVTAQGATELEIVSGPTKVAIEQVLDEANFFVSQGLFQEAILLLEEAHAQFPSSDLVKEKLFELRKEEAKAREVHATLPRGAAGDWVDARTSTSQAANGAIEALGAIEKIISPQGYAAPAGDDSLVTHLGEVDAAEAQTRYDVGIAYMEMGLWQQAIAEFRIAAQNRQLEATSYSLIGQCLLASQNIDEAINEFKMGLFAKEKTPEQEMELYYNIAEAYIRQNDYKEALYYLQTIKKRNPSYKDVASKIDQVTAYSHKATVAAKKRAPPALVSQEAAKEIDSAFDDLFGDTWKK